jgi:hypothetical protein
MSCRFGRAVGGALDTGFARNRGNLSVAADSSCSRASQQSDLSSRRTCYRASGGAYAGPDVTNHPRVDLGESQGRYNPWAPPAGLRLLGERLEEQSGVRPGPRGCPAHLHGHFRDLPALQRGPCREGSYVRILGHLRASDRESADQGHTALMTIDLSGPATGPPRFPPARGAQGWPARWCSDVPHHRC